ncbi:SET domain [Macleaya cordata]|uniref:SET domain n=1 Tax=Macleaya cordata TaxID=56857 RepID=A0A200Q063_MACCD|nr:SET domain [Macleaya cordata]
MGCCRHSNIVDESFSGLSSDSNCLFPVETSEGELGSFLENTEKGLFDKSRDFEGCENDILPCPELAPLSLNYNGDIADKLVLEKGLCSEEACLISNAYLNIEDRVAVFLSPGFSNIVASMNSVVDQEVRLVGRDGQEEDGYLNTVLSVSEQIPNSEIGVSVVDQLCCSVSTKESLMENKEFQSEDGIENSNQDGETCLPLSPLIASPIRCNEQNEQKDAKTFIPPDETVKDHEGIVEEKHNVLPGTSNALMTQVSDIEENTCNLIEGPPNIAFECAIEDSTSLQLSQHFGVLDISSFDCSGMQRHQEIDSSGGPPSCSLIDSTMQADNEGKDIVKPDFASTSTCTDIITSPPQRSTRQSKLVKITETRKTARRSRKPTNNMFPVRAIAMSLEIARGKRSCLSKRARSSIWGTLGNIINVFTENDGLLKYDPQFNQIEKQGSQKRKGGQGGKRLKSTRTGGSSRTSKKGNCRAITGHICLKVKRGGDLGQTSPQVVLPDVIDSLASAQAVVGECALESNCQITLEISKLVNDVDHKIVENVHDTRQFTSCSTDLENPVTFQGASVRDFHQGDISVVNALGDLESTVTQDISVVNTLGDCPGVSSQSGTETLGEAVVHRYSDPGTSPDSEVINVIQDDGVGARGQEDLRDTVLSCSQSVGPIGVTTSKKMKSKRKGKKNGKVKGPYPLVGYAPAEEKFRGPRSLKKSRNSAKCRPGLRVEDGLNPTDTVISATSGSVSISSSCMEGYPMEPFTVPGPVELGARLKVDTVLESCEMSGDLLPSCKTIGLKLPKSPQSSAGLSKHRSRAPDSARRTSGNSRQKKKGDSLKSVNKSKVKEKDILVQVASKGENHLETDEDVNICLSTGKHSELQGQPELSKINVMGPGNFDDQEKMNIGNKFASEDMSKSSLVSNVSDEKFLPLRNAWVRCDDCHKWRCISAALADSIEETNCQWTCKDNMDKAFAGCSIPQEKTNAEINAELEISDASCEEDVCYTNSNRKGFETKQLTVSKPSSWAHIKSNLFLHRRRKTQTIDEIMVCHCKPPQDGQLGCGDECLNRMLNIECVQGTCPCGDLCSNQQFQKRKYAKFKWFRCGKKGFGLQLQQNVYQGAFLIEYVGEVLDLHTYEVRQKEYASRGQKHFYFMTLNGSEVIDACAKGNLGRFINHSCDPNCRTEKWMVNGEVCIGLFALRDLKKGEEVTFDYNYVRVFGAAAKRCVCGSPECRGYIGGDPLNTEVVVQGDSDEEYPEPVMVPEDSYCVDIMDIIVSDSGLAEGALVQHTEGSLHASSTMITPSIEQLENSSEQDSRSRSVSSVQPLEISLLTEDTTSQSPSDTQEISLQPEDINYKSSSDVNPLQLSVGKEESTRRTSVMIQPLEASSLTTSSTSKSSSDSIAALRKCISETVEDKPSISKSPHVKSSRSSISIKKGKSSSCPVITNKPRVLANKPKKLLEGAASSRLEGVEDKLNELLDADGGISKRKDSTKGYLKLLLVTAASGDNVNGEAVQSTRDLSIILDALLKTKSRMVLGDIINKNGSLQMLHNIMKQNRRNFNKTPIIRKLLKVLEYLALKKILTVEHINSGPPCAGIESFRESILQLTRHGDVQVHQIARNFRDTYIPRPNRRISCSNRENGNFEIHSGSSFSRLSSSYRRWNDQEGVRPTEAVNANTHLGSSGPCSDGCPTNGAKTRKRKSRWDQPAETNPEDPQPPELITEDQNLNLKQKLEANQQQSVIEVGGERNICNGCDQSLLPQDDLMQQIHEDAPPGFPAPFSSSPSVPSNTSSSTASSSLSRNTNTYSGGCEVITGCLQGRYLSHLPVSYGIPVSFVEQLGTPTQAGMVDSWVIAPSIPFHPFPPLPRFPRDKSKTLPPPTSAMKTNGGCGEEVQREGNCHQADISFASTSGARPPEGSATGKANNDQQMVHERMRCFSTGGGGSLGKRYFRQQKWVNRRNGPPWISRRNNGWMGSKGSSNNNSRSGVQNVGLGNVEKSQRVSENNINSSTLYQQHPQYRYE